MQRVFAALLAAVPVPASCLAQPARPAAEPAWPSPDVIRPAGLTPLAFLDVLQARRGVPHGVRTDVAPQGWVRRDDIPALLALVGSTEPAAATSGIVAAHTLPPDARSTPGQGAMQLIEGCRRRYRSETCLDLAPPGDPNEAGPWWAKGGKLHPIGGDGPAW